MWPDNLWYWMLIYYMLQGVTVYAARCREQVVRTKQTKNSYKWNEQNVRIHVQYETVNIRKILFLGLSFNFYLAWPGKHADARAALK